MAAEAESADKVLRRYKREFLFNELLLVSGNALNSGLSLRDVKNVCRESSCENAKAFDHHLSNRWRLGFKSLMIIVIIFLMCFVIRLPILDGMMKNALGIKCVVPNNYFVWEATRPIADCNMCKGVNGVLILPNITREEFHKYAYSSRPIIVKGAASHWPAKQLFSYNYFKDIFENIDGSYENIEEDCQFLTFKTDFLSLRDVFSMSRRRLLNWKGERPWYIGWSNCYPPVLNEMRKHYSRPHFLPADAEHAHVDYVFMGYQQGAVMHLDYISRLMWQAQLRGHKTWRLNPPPECEAVCSGYSFRVHPGDILLLDTRQWYHDTHIDEGEFSLTVSSEYG
ncbi:hypothetical protein LSTR_LSTR001116 [Laodelphax striatellus]|uniref:Cupin-like domain-containing protein n=1 Tax=Laodelphax striatellus TaxID=195883 RepID=A0A482X155_LAOST|nr:hypothetical protein LSTR_LSTR001116 [Laodelphax striatellus]